ncbi:Cys-tRNA(Pro) deacylase [Cellvibrio polysaccharolyticus]|uniref:Cys-tRNA(Pro)/Cys-tRNA(Cys) deacylase n=1 Tax=Cellvibrio polysaccharolyticus TaxID=2082724 RepID=A0A928YTV2_9GAMM|nr:Cys-tRNA(Pro) deacylase [Cellvibrio polysaccharolyticus]MBE8717252.1 Cys-tRNA(Pro) deacylase [Cellvibrio polysaccharolyticus]
MTPAILLAQKHQVEHHIHQYHHDPAAESYGEEAAQKLGVSTEQVFKTLVVMTDSKELITGVVPVSGTLDLKKIAKAAGEKKVVMADKQLVEKVTGYVLGGVSPLGQKKALRTFVDESAQYFDTVFVSAGKRGLEIELAPDDLCKLTEGKFADIGRE